MRIIDVKYNDLIENEDHWQYFDPYIILGTKPKKFMPKDLIIGEVLKLKDCYIEIINQEATGLFGKDSFSFIHFNIKKTNKRKNPNRYFLTINTKEPYEKYGGILFGEWCDNVEDCILNYFPKRYLEKSKFLKITNINRMDLERGEKTNLEILDKYNKILNNIKVENRKRKLNKLCLQQ